MNNWKINILDVWVLMSNGCLLIAPITWLNYFLAQIIYQGGAVASWLVRAVRVRALAGDIVLC